MDSVTSTLHVVSGKGLMSVTRKLVCDKMNGFRKLQTGLQKRIFIMSWGL